MNTIQCHILGLTFNKESFKIKIIAYGWDIFFTQMSNSEPDNITSYLKYF
jgi:hypothetical protein